MRHCTVYSFRLFITILFVASLRLSAQDIHFSQFYMSQLSLNPATAGAFKAITAVANYRDQWRSINSPYRTYSVGADMRLLKKNWKNTTLGIGLNVFSDKAGDGDLATTQVALSFASHLKISETQKISAGLQLAGGQRSINFSALTWDNQFDGFSYNASLPSGELAGNSSFLYPDLGFGLLWQFEKSEMYISGNDQLQANIGFSLQHINQPRLSFYSSANDQLYMKYVVHGNGLVGIKNTPLSVMPGFVYYRQGPAQEIKFGSMLKYTLKEDSKYTGYIKGASVAGGVYYRFQDAVVITGLLELANYAIGVSYDVNVSELRTASYGQGGFEITLRYVNPSNFLYQNKARFN